MFNCTVVHTNGWPHVCSPMRRFFRSCQFVLLKTCIPGLFFLIFIIILSFVTDKPTIIVHPESQTKTEGENVTLTCNATGNPAPTISWTRNGSPIDTSDNSRISFSGNKKQLTITNVSRTDSGEYRCVANNSLGIDTSNLATLNVQCKYDVLCQVPSSSLLFLQKESSLIVYTVTNK